MKFEDVKTEFERFEKSGRSGSFSRISEFFESLKGTYLKEKTRALRRQGLEAPSIHVKARESWMSFARDSFQKLLVIRLRETLDGRRAKVESGGRFSGLPLSGSDVVVYRRSRKKANIFCVIAVKSSLNEKIFDSAYLKLKLSGDKATEKARVLAASIDRYLRSVIVREESRRIERIVTEHEMDRIYLGRKPLPRNAKVKSVQNIFKDLNRFSRRAG